MKRKVVPTCAAADDDDFAAVVYARSTERKTRRGEITSDEGGQSSRAESLPQKKKEKEFAWMDSEEEEEGGGEEVMEAGEQENRNGLERSRGRVRKDDHGTHRSEEHGAHGTQDPEKDGDSGQEDEDVSAGALDQVQSFGRLMLLAPSLHRQLRDGNMSPVDVAAACRALGRTKFFDGELLEDLGEALRKLLRKERLSVAQAHDAVECLSVLNAYDKGVFSAVASAFRSKTALLEPAIRSAWLKAFQGFGHNLEKDFLQTLEVPPLFPNSPCYKRIRCYHLGSCALGSLCTFSHDPKAPLTLETELARASPVIMTHCQETMGRDKKGSCAYGLMR
mmetsp:Transcript_85588/g.191309  ORF Transcript_85588/g.191309 Transcript_85588/m.191309 type:complete len:335 (-) Transcript_85588:360-1364(-)